MRIWPAIRRKAKSRPSRLAWKCYIPTTSPLLRTMELLSIAEAASTAAPGVGIRATFFAERLLLLMPVSAVSILLSEPCLLSSMAWSSLDGSDWNPSAWSRAR